MQYLFQPLHHARAIRRWALDAGGSFAISGMDFTVAVWLGDRTLRLRPRFTVRVNDALAYTEDMARGIGFVGWSPTEARSWALAADKIEFKRHCVAHGVRTPEFALPGVAVRFDHLVKKRRGSFGFGIDGPFRAAADGLPGAPVDTDAFAERFISGRAAKCWYWNGRPAALEIVDPPTITGDGRRTIGELLAQPRGSFDRAQALDPAAAMLQWQGLGADTVLDAQASAWLGFKYVTPHDRMTLLDRDQWREAPQPLREAFAHAGAVAHAGIGEAMRGDAAFTLDAVVDADGHPWFLEMNSHPMLHPAIYAPMLDELLGRRPAAPGA